MKPMRSNKVHSLIACLILSVGYITSAQAVTDAELDALEKQIEQQEAEENQKAEVEAKRKAEEKRKAEVEAKKQEEAEAKRYTVEKAKRKAVAEAEKKRLAELERKQLEEDVKRKAEEEKRTKEEKYNKHNKLAEAYMAEDKFNLAIKEYELLLESFPEDVQTVEKLKEAQGLENVCHEIVGTWIVQPNGRTWIINEDKTAYGTWLIFNAHGFWECLSARKREFRTSWPDCVVCGTEYLILSDDGNTLMPSRNSGSTGRRVINSK